MKLLLICLSPEAMEQREDLLLAERNGVSTIIVSLLLGDAPGDARDLLEAFSNSLLSFNCTFCILFFRPLCRSSDLLSRRSNALLLPRYTFHTAFWDQLLGPL